MIYIDTDFLTDTEIEEAFAALAGAVEVIDTEIEPFADEQDPQHVCEPYFEAESYPTRSGRITITGQCTCLRVLGTMTDSIV